MSDSYYWRLPLELIHMITMWMLFLLFFFKVSHTNGKVVGDHVCQTEITKPVEFLEWTLKNKTVRTYKWCLNVPPRCSVYSNKVINETSVSIKNVTTITDACCDGFQEQDGHCVKVCKRCINGLCLKGATCVCHNGWTGPNCDSHPFKNNEKGEQNSRKLYFINRNATNVEFVRRVLGNKREYLFQSPIREHFNESIQTLSSGEQSTTYFRDVNKDLTSEKTKLIDDQRFLEKHTTSQSMDSRTLDDRKRTESHEDFITISNNIASEFNTGNNSTDYFQSTNYFQNSRENLYSQTSTENTFLDDSYNLKGNKSMAMEKIGDTNNNFDNDVEEKYNTTEKQKYRNKIPLASITKKEPVTDYSNEIVEYRKAKLNYKYFEKERNSGDVMHQNQEFSTAEPAISLEKHYFSEGEKDISANFDDEIFSVGSYQKKINQSSIFTNIETNHSLIYSVGAASISTILILLVAVTLFALRNTRRKLERNKKTKDVGSVAVYTTSIFHTPLPDPPIFEDTTFASTSENPAADCENVEVQEFNIIFQKPMKNPVMEKNLSQNYCKQYVYDHPPSTGSYRASSEVDTLSQMNLSHKSLFGIVMEPLYDEIPPKNVPGSSSCVDNIQKDISCVYMNACSGTRF